MISRIQFNNNTAFGAKVNMNPKTLYREGLAHIGSGDYKTGMRLFEQAEKIIETMANPDDGIIRIRTLMLEQHAIDKLRKQDIEGARNIYNHAIKLADKNAETRHMIDGFYERLKELCKLPEEQSLYDEFVKLQNAWRKKRFLEYKNKH